MPENVEQARKKKSGFRACSNLKDKENINWEDNLLVDGPSVLVGDDAIRPKAPGPTTRRFKAVFAVLRGSKTGNPYAEGFAIEQETDR